MRAVVFCPPAYQTGGPEALHQLVDSIRRQGGVSDLCFSPAASGAVAKPERYAIYDSSDITSQAINDEDLLIVPEGMTDVMSEFPSNPKAIWWLSLDNHLNWHSLRSGTWFSRPRAIKNIAADPRAAIDRFRSVRQADLHLTQSHYAEMALRRQGFKTAMLSDYTVQPTESPDQPRYEPERVLGRIAINGAKGATQAARFQQLHPTFETIVLKELSKSELETTLRASQFYVDFGHHPGKDRLPREAARAGCIVFVRRQGAADNPIDVLLPEDRRFDCSKRGLLELGRQLRAVAADPTAAINQQRRYVDRIEREQATFDEEVRTSLALLFDPKSFVTDHRPTGPAHVSA